MNATSVPGVSVAAADAERAEQQHDGDREVGDHLEEGPELRATAGPCPSRCRRACARPRRSGRTRAVARPNALMTRMPTAPSSTARGQVALLVLDPPGDRRRSAARSAWTAMTIGTDGGRDDQAERPVHRAAARTVTTDELEDVDDQEQQAEAEEPADRSTGRWSPGRAAARTATGRGRPSAAAAGARRGRAASSVSMPSTALDCTQRRRKISTASRTPRAEREQAEREQRRRARASAIGPSMIALVTSGMAMVRPTPASAVVDHDHERREVGPEVAAEPPQGPDPGSGVVVGTGGLGGCVRHRLVGSPRFAWRSAARHAGLVTRWSRGGWKL